MVKIGTNGVRNWTSDVVCWGRIGMEGVSQRIARCVDVKRKTGIAMK